MIQKIFIATLLLLSPAVAVDFVHEVLPILQESCAKCHTNGQYKGGLSLDTREALLGSDDAVIVGDAASSLFIQLLTATDPDDRMPQKADPLPAEQIEILTKWINEGVAWEPGFTFKEKTWIAPLKPRKPNIPPATETLTNPIDLILKKHFEQNQLTPPAPISDSAFLRRASLDLIGLLPSPADIVAFEKLSDPNKHTKKVATLLQQNGAYADHWMTFWNDLLRNDYSGTGFIDGGRKQITTWLYSSLENNLPYDQFVSQLLNPSADSEGFIKGIKWRGDVNASQVQEIQYAQNVSQVFFGENLKCASCHDSFINDWKLEDAYGMAAIFAAKPLEMFRCDKPTGNFAKPKFLFAELGEIDASAPPKQQLKRAAELATSPENGRLSRTIVNRLWARFMGHGLVEPVDMMGNQPWNEDLLDFLAWDLAENDFDLKRTMTLITTSNIYRSASVPPPGEAEEFVFKGPIAKRLTAEQFIDAVWELTGTKPNKIDANVKRAVQNKDASSPNLTSAQWIWSAVGDRPAGESVSFSHKFKTNPKPTSASIAITCDNEYTLFLNDQKIGADSNWETIEVYDISTSLKPNAVNQLRVEAKNLGNGAGPAGLIAALHTENGLSVVSGAHWKVGNNNAVVLPDSSIWAAAQASSPTGTTPSARAALVHSTLLMRALGRPNREQVVTTRPDDLTTLQALELNNGLEFVGYLNAGASRWFRDYSNQPNELLTSLYNTTLSRPPTLTELEIGGQILGTPMTQESVADLLWTVLMLPEFQLIQ